MANLNIDVITDENLAKSKEKYDIIFMSSVFHEIISYMSRPERIKVLKQIHRNLKKDGKLIIRDWANKNSDIPYTLHVKNEKVSKEVDKEYQTTEKEAYELVFHVVWGLQSLERESKEEYNIHDYLEKWLLKPLNFKVSNVIEEKDESYLQYLQKYFKLKEVPFYTKCILILEKEEI